MNISTIDLVLLVAAVWRLSNILAHKEEGPFRLFWYPHLWVRRAIRKNKNGWVARSKIADGLECEYCNSIWFGSIIGGLYLWLGDVVLTAIFPLALSTGAIIIKHIVFLIKSVDTRYDQQNQWYLANKDAIETLPRPSIYPVQISTNNNHKVEERSVV